MKKHFTKATCLVSLSLSALAGVGMWSALSCAACFVLDSSPRDYPIRFPFFLLTGSAALFLFLGLLCLYTKYRSKAPSVPGVIVDVLGAIILSPGFGLLFGFVCEWGAKLLR